MELCGVSDEDTFTTIHHEMGHIQYYMSYSDQPPLFRVRGGELIAVGKG